MLVRLMSGGKQRKTRLHDEKGNFAGWKNVLLHSPRAVASGALRLLVGYSPELPWISYAAIRVLERHLSNTSRVLEFGSGMSTIWYAKHAGHVCAIEDDKRWYEIVSERLAKAGLHNAQCKFTEDHIEYQTYMSLDRLGFDLIMIDGSHRSKCVQHAQQLLRSGGILYLDNSDKDSSPQGGDTRLAEQYVLKFAAMKKAQIRYFTDFAPAQLFAQQGLMLTLGY